MTPSSSHTTATAMATATSSSLAQSIKEHARRELMRVLDSVPGKKGLVIDARLSGPLSLIAEYSLLKVCECDL